LGGEMNENELAKLQAQTLKSGINFVNEEVNEPITKTGTI